MASESVECSEIREEEILLVELIVPEEAARRELAGGEVAEGLKYGTRVYQGKKPEALAPAAVSCLGKPELLPLQLPLSLAPSLL